jgi:hypothetical protein
MFAVEVVRQNGCVNAAGELDKDFQIDQPRHVIKCLSNSGHSTSASSGQFAACRFCMFDSVSGRGDKRGDCRDTVEER